MREIEFRGKRLDNGEWVRGYYCKHIKRQVCPMGDELKPEDIAHLIINDGFADWNMPRSLQGYDVDPGTVGQLVRKGSETRFDIYAGDILQDDWGYKYVIEWDNEDTIYRARSIITGELETLHGKWAIGTEHDNPELLEVI